MPCSFAYPINWDDAKRLIREARHNYEQSGDFLPLVIFLLGFNTAFRIAELQRITWNMVLDGRVRLYTKGGARREVPISGQLREELMFIYKRSNPDRFWPVLHYPSHRRKEGSPVSVAGSIKIITRYFDKLGLEGTPTNHMMRKTFAMRMYELLGKNEDALIKVSVLLSHRDTYQTRVYLNMSLNSDSVNDYYRLLQSEM
jgi:integrase